MSKKKVQHHIFSLAWSNIILLLMAYIFIGDILAFPVNRFGHNYLVDQWDVGDNLPGNCIISMAQTPDGYMWFATTKGLTRFDGLRFSTIHFLKDNVGKVKNISPDFLCVDSKGILWIGSSAGLTRYNYRTRQFKTYTAKDGITADRIRLITEDIKGNLWISFDDGYVNRFTDGQFQVFDAANGLEGKRINAIVEDSKGHLLFGTRENGIFNFREEEFSNYKVQRLNKDHLIITMLVDREDNLWIGSNKGLFQVDSSTNRVSIYTTRHGLASDYITNILEDKDSHPWIGTVNGLNRMKQDKTGSISVDHFLDKIVITCLYRDQENSLWIGTYDMGIRRLKEARLSSYSIKVNGQEDIILSLFEDRQGDIRVGTLAGRLCRCRDSKLIDTVEIPGIKSIGITAIAEDSIGNLWIGTNGRGVFMEKGKGFTNFTTRDGLVDNLVTSIFVDSRGDLWFSTFGGVSRYRDGILESYKDRGVQTRVHNVYEDKNHHILFATDKGIKVIKNGAFIENKMTGYFKNIQVTCILEDTGLPGNAGSDESVFWIATHGAGLKRYKNGTLTSYTTARGMTSNFIYQMFVDDRENLWMMSDSGILRVAKSELDQMANGQVKRINCISFGISDGMQSIEFNNIFSRHSAIKTSDGEIRCTTTKGIAIVHPGSIKINKSPPPIIIETVLCNDSPISFHRDGKNNTFKKIDEIAFQFTAPTFLSPEKVTFKYRLEGFDRDWVFLPPGKKRAASYNNLGPGTYIFTVTASNSDGVWNSSGDSFSFTMKPLFYNTIFFKGGIFIFLLVLPLLIYFLYKKQKEKDRKSYKNSSLNPVFVEECIKKLMHLMEIEKVYQDESISLQSMAEKIAITHHQLSQLLNEKMNKSFPDFINTYRVEEAKKLLGDPKWEDRKILSIAFEVGYNTKAAFYNVFKKYTNMTPSQYRQEVLNKK